MKDRVGEEEGDEVWSSLCREPHFEHFMPFSRWKDFHHFFPENFGDEEKKILKRYKFSPAVDEFINIYKNELCGALWISIDETMCAWKPHETAHGGLPHTSFIARKPEPLGKNLII